MGDPEENARAIEAELRSIASAYEDGQFGTFWRQVKQVSDMFKTLKPIRREDRERLWKELGTLCDNAKDQQAKLDDQSKANAHSLEGEIQSLASQHWSGIMCTQRDYGAFWAHAKEVSQMFKTLKPIRREERERLWQKFSAACEETRDRQNSENEGRRFKSEQHRSDILAEAERARPCDLPLPGLGIDVQEMKALGQVLREAGQLLSKYKHEMFGEHKQECFDRIQEVRRAHDVWWDLIKGQRVQQHQDYQARVRANLEKNYEQHRRATDALSRARAHADDLRDQIASAWSDDFRERASGWLAEQEEKIADIEAHIQRIEGWISENEQKLR